MFVTLANTVRFASIATLALMAACDMQSPQQTPAPSAGFVQSTWHSSGGALAGEYRVVPRRI